MISTGAPFGWDLLFPHDRRVVALPSWTQPRLLIPVNARRVAWAASAFYPAYRWTGRLRRAALRVRALSSIGAVLVTHDHEELLREYLRDVLPDAQVRAVQVGMPGGAQKLTAQLVDASGRVVGFLKCGAHPLSRQRLRIEHDILARLPAGAGPRALKFGAMGSFDALLLAPVEGRHLRSSLPPPPALTPFLEALQSTRVLALNDHPWFVRLGSDRDEVAMHLDVLSKRSWPLVLQHGDLAPWNMLRLHDGRLVAIDWEYGRVDSLPGLDLAQFVLQVAMLIERCAPVSGLLRAAALLELNRSLELTREESLALVALAAFEAHKNAAEEGLPFEDPRQRWRRAMWQRPS
jgi:choline/ethanolamine kinase